MIRLDQQLIFKILIVAGLIFRTLDCTSDRPTQPQAQDAQYDQYDQSEEPYYDQFDNHNPGGYDYDYENSEESQYYQTEPAEPPLDQPDPDSVQQSDSAANSVDPYQGEAYLETNSHLYTEPVLIYQAEPELFLLFNVYVINFI